MERRQSAVNSWQWTVGGRHMAVVLIGALGLGASAQNDPPCFFSEQFSGAGIPAGWDIGPQVEQFDDLGNALGTFVDAWTVGDDDDANAQGHFPVPYRIGQGSFIMANDDAAVCDCDMNDVRLTSPTIDLSTRVNTALECNVFLDQSFNGGAAAIEGSTDGSSWSTLFVITATPRLWRPIWIDLSAFDGSATFQVRFTWTDNGEYAAGFALDDVCIYERSTNDLALVDAQMTDVTSDLFSGSERGIVYRMLPLEQAGPSSLKASAVLLNRGISTLIDASFTVEAVVGGTQQAINTSTAIPSLAPGARDTLTVDLGWWPDAVGTVVFNWNAQHIGTEDLPDNQAWTDSLRVTGAGFDGGYNTMSVDRYLPDGSMGVTGNKFSAGARFELEGAGSVVYGLRTRYAFGTNVGAQVRARLMDGLLNELAASEVLEVSTEDLFTSFFGDPVYIPFTEPYGPVTGDVFALIESIPDSGDVRVATSGTSPYGGSVLLKGLTEVVNWTSRTPLVRLALAEPMVSIAETPASTMGALQVYPSPSRSSTTNLLPPQTMAGGQLMAIDATGRTVREWPIAPGCKNMVLDVSVLTNGAYVLRSLTTDRIASGRLIVQH